MRQSHRSSRGDDGAVNRLGSDCACLHAKQGGILVITPRSRQMTKNFNPVVNRQALILLGKGRQLGNTCIRAKNRLAVADQKRFDEAPFGVHGHQNIDGFTAIASHRLEVD